MRDAPLEHLFGLKPLPARPGAMEAAFRTDHVLSVLSGWILPEQEDPALRLVRHLLGPLGFWRGRDRQVEDARQALIRQHPVLEDALRERTGLADRWHRAWLNRWSDLLPPRLVLRGPGTGAG